MRRSSAASAPTQQMTFPLLCSDCERREGELESLQSILERVKEENTSLATQVDDLRRQVRNPRQEEAREHVEEHLDAWKRHFVKNPHIWEEIERRCLALWREGRRHYSISAVFEAVRYHTSLTTDEKPFRLSNTFRAIYARMFVKFHPEAADLLDLHPSIFDGHEPWVDVRKGGTE